MVNNPNFRELLIYVGGGACLEEDIPHRTKLTNEIIEAWKQERKGFADDMKVHLMFYVSDFCGLTLRDRMLLGGYR